MDRVRFLMRISMMTLALLLAGAGCSGQDTDTSDADVLVDGGAMLPYMSMCERNEQCETGTCFGFNKKGPHCTHACTTDDECEEPSGGCGNKGVCKPPDLDAAY